MNALAAQPLPSLAARPLPSLAAQPLPPLAAQPLPQDDGLSVPWGAIRLRRDGASPLRFAGRLVARRDGHTARAPLWHDLAFYRAAFGAYAVAIVAVRAGQPPVAVRCHAYLVASLDAALAGFETHDAAGDVCPGLSAPSVAFNDPALPAAAMLLQAAALHAARADAVRRYQIGVGAFLAALARRDP